MKLDFTKITEKTAVWCDTEEKAGEFVKQAIENRLATNHWNNGNICWDYKYETCYFINTKSRTMNYANRKFATEEGYTIIPFNDLIIKEDKAIDDMVNNPPHYTFGKFEVIDVINDWDLNFNKGNAIKYIARAEYKGTEIQDLEKAVCYLNYEIEKLKAREL